MAVRKNNYVMTVRSTDSFLSARAAVTKFGHYDN